MFVFRNNGDSARIAVAQCSAHRRRDRDARVARNVPVAAIAL
jgi:hypothetical protein